MKKFTICFVIIFHIIAFYSQSKSSQHAEKELAYRVLMQDPVFSRTYEFGKAKYKELYQVIQDNGFTEDEGETIIFKQGDLIYIFYKKFELIESLGLGHKNSIYSNGRMIHDYH